MNQVKHVKHCQTIESEQISDQISIVPSIFPGVFFHPGNEHPSSRGDWSSLVASTWACSPARFHQLLFLYRLYRVKDKGYKTCIQISESHIASSSYFG